MRTFFSIMVLVVASFPARIGNDAFADAPREAEVEMNEVVYTHALWRVKPGRETAFIEAWDGLARIFSGLEDPPLWGTLLQSETDPNVFYSFGPWRSGKDVENMRGNETAQEGLARIMDLCEESTPGMYRVVRHVKVASN